MANTWNAVARKAMESARAMQDEGKVPLYLGVHGMLALIHREVDEFINRSNDQRSLLIIAAYSLCILYIEEEEREWDNLAEEELAEEDEDTPPGSDGPWDGCMKCGKPLESCRCGLDAVIEDTPPEENSPLAAQGVREVDDRFTPVLPGQSLQDIKDRQHASEEEEEGFGSGVEEPTEPG